MARIYCTKCGIRGDSKCPHHRSVFPDRMPDEQDALDNFIKVRTQYKLDDYGNRATYKWGPHEGELVCHKEVYFESYKNTDEEALLQVISFLQRVFSNGTIDLKVATCVHQWELMPGVHAEIGCCIGPINDNVPVDPFENWKKENK